MSLFAFGVIVNTKRLEILKMSHLESDIKDDNTILLLWWLFPSWLPDIPPASPHSAVHGQEIKQKSLCAEKKAA